MLLKQLLWRGDRLSIEAGQIVLIPKSGKQAAADAWLADNHDLLLSEILELTGKRGFRYQGFSVGKYTVDKSKAGKSPKKAGGLTLQLIDLLTHETVCCCFNVRVDRDRNTRHGTTDQRKKGKQFIAPAGGHFVAFWKRCGLALPRGRLSVFHDYMGRLRPIILQGQLAEPGKADKQSLKPMTIDHDQLMKAASLLPDNSRTSAGQLPDNSRTRMPDKETHQHQQTRGIQTDLTTWQNQCVKKVNGNAVIRHAPIPNEIDEWLNDYGAASNE
jgi:hypothetical protein